MKQLAFLENYKLNSKSLFQFNNISDCFDYFDENNDQTIKADELQNVIKYFSTCSISENIQLPTSEDEISNLMSVLDVDGNGSVERTEFINWLRKGAFTQLIFNDVKINDNKLTDEENEKVNNFFNIVLNSLRIPNTAIEDYVTKELQISDDDVDEIQFEAVKTFAEGLAKMSTSDIEMVLRNENKWRIF